ncbi:pentapeptide repeat-containing protein [Kordiimonas marina]|uniref:pentapeptide repeat-containing protein n=1 Tax=Kordiimonas marina TaxID=2872312 RepID=UPI001FF2D99E|nr:pentapeptide repeat-containing protein [Kordiimonas marina]MCJ9430678.1 pentapeptide repeat-containing protein [Kordiimonas marina]
MDLKTLTNMFPLHTLIMGEQFAQESITALKVRSVIRWSETLFVNCDFSEAQLHMLLMNDVIFFDCDFSGANFTACDIDGCEFISCNLTCSNFEGASVRDTSFTDCVIGGIAGPMDMSSCIFTNVRYSRHIPITSRAPYYVVSTESSPLYIFRTGDEWRIHSQGTRLIVPGISLKETSEPYRSIILGLLQQELSARRPDLSREDLVAAES